LGGSPARAGGAARARVCFKASRKTNELTAKELPPLPVPAHGAFVGTVGGALIVAGGARAIGGGDAPSAWPLLDTIYVLPPPKQEKEADTRSAARKVLDGAGPLLGAARARRQQASETFGEWQLAEAKLKTPVAFGAAAVYENALICLGGCTATGTTGGAFRIRYDKGKVTVEEQSASLPNLPEPIAFHSARAMGNVLYVAGGLTLDAAGARISRGLYMLEFERVLAKAGGPLGPLKDWAEKRSRVKAADKARVAAWKAVPMRQVGGGAAAPLGEGLLQPLMNVRRDEGSYRDALYLFGGRRPGSVAGRYSPSAACWKYIPGEESRAGWRRIGDLPEGIEVGAASPIGPAHLLAMGRRTSNSDATLAETAAGAVGGCAFLYHTYTDTWLSLENEPLGAAGLCCPMGSAAAWLELPSGDSNAKASARKIEAVFREKPFGVLNAMVVYGFFGSMVLMGYLCRKEHTTTEEYFLSGRRIPWWASGLSMWATGVSAISMMAIPAKTYATDWTYMWLGIFPPVILSVSAMVFMPLFRRMTIMSMTEYFEMRFHPSIRVLSSFLGVLGHTGAKMSVTLLVPSLAMSAVTGWDVYFCVIIMGLVTIVYTVVGGMDAVIWTDVAQSVIMFLAPILSIGIIISRLDGGFGEFFQVGAANAKFRILDASPDLTVATFWVFLIWSVTQFFGVLGQETMQRAWATDGVKAAKRSVYTLAAVSLPGTLLFYSIGTALFAYYRQHPDDLNPAIKNDGIFPLYVVQNLPAGLSGLMIAAIFAAAISMAMNTSSTIVTRDFFRFFFRDAPDSVRMRFGWWGTLVSGVIATGIAVALASLNSSSLWDLFSKLMALVGGGFGGVIVLGVLTRRANTLGAWVGTVIGTVTLVYLEVFTRTSFFVYGTIALAVSFGVGYVVSLLFPGRPRDLAGLTVWTLPKDT
jgi:SSS family transporter